MSTGLAIIGGSGLNQLQDLNVDEQRMVETPYGKPSGPLQLGELNGTPVTFLPRHGTDHDIAPHRINYRANLWALKEAGVGRIIGVAAVGGITAKYEPQSLIVPTQIIDYTWSRDHTLYDTATGGVEHIDLTEPFSPELRFELQGAADELDVPLIPQATYGVTQGPRLETAAEIDRMERDGCDVVGMTAMPETALARELGLDYALCALVVNWAAGRGAEATMMDEIEHNLVTGMENVRRLIAAAVQRII